MIWNICSTVWNVRSKPWNGERQGGGKGKGSVKECERKRIFGAFPADDVDFSSYICPQDSEPMQKFIWIARQILTRGPMTQEEILEAWAQEDARGRRMAVSTFYDNRQILAKQFGIRLVRETNGRYRMEKDDDAAAELLMRLGEGARQRKVSRAEVWRPLLEDARTERFLARMTYASLHGAAYETTFAAYTLHESGGQQYVIGHSSKHGAVRTFALDRIRTLQLLPQHFAPPARHDFFTHSIGATSGEAEEATRIVLRATEECAAYLRSRPLHSSQKEGSEPTVFTLDVALDRELVRRVLSFGADLEILSPEALRTAVYEAADAICRHYRREA